MVAATVVDEASLLEKLRRIEALFAGATTEGEKIAAAEARRRMAIAPMLRVLGETEWDHIIHDRIGLAQHRGDAAAAAIPRVVNETTAPLARAALLPAYAERGRARASAPRMSKSGYGLPSRELEVLQLEQAVARRWCFGHP